MSNDEECNPLNASWGTVKTDDETSDSASSLEFGVSGSPAIEDVERVVKDEFGCRTWYASLAVLSAIATLLLSDEQACTGVMLVGPSSSGKTTVLRLFQEASHEGENLVYKTDDMTPAAFVSHDPTRSEDELDEIDLIERIQHKALLNFDMASWFAGDRNQIREKLSTLAKAMDGDGLTTDSGAHGSRGYEGDYRFVLACATTPIGARSWDVMGNLGHRLVSYTLPSEEDLDQIAADVIGNSYADNIDRCQEVVADYISDLWDFYGGYGSVEWEGEELERSDIIEALQYFTRLVKFARARLDESGNPRREAAHRPFSTLYNLARGHALLYGRERLQTEDLETVARIALSTMHKERRGIVRATIDPSTSRPIGAREIVEHEATTCTRKTARKRMRLLQDLGLGETVAEDNGRGTTRFALRKEFEWPSEIQYPVFR